MTTAIAFVNFLLAFVPFALLVTAALFAFWIATLLIPSLNAWMNDTSDMAETEYEVATRIRNSSTNFDQYI